jgi:hypothetical protein
MSEQIDNKASAMMMVVKPLLKSIILPKLEEGNPAEFIEQLKPYLEAGKINPDTGQPYFPWPAQVKGLLYLEVNPHDAQHPINIRRVEDKALVFPMDPEAIKAFAIQIINNALAEPDAGAVVNQITQG